MDDFNSRIETESEIQAFISKMHYALENGARIHFQEKRRVDDKRNTKYTNAYTVRDLFPDENPVEALKRELKSLSINNYIRTVQDRRFPDRSEMREFGKTYNIKDDVYIKIRVEVFNSDEYGSHTVFVMSFHYAVYPFSDDIFPYRKS